MSQLQITDLDQYLTTPPAPSTLSNLRTFYSPIDDVHGALKAVIGSAQHSVVVAMYGFDDDDLAAMLDGYLKNPSIFVQISLDKSQAGGVHEKQILTTYAAEMSGTNSVAIGTSEKSAIMHRKMVIVDGEIRISGSTNWSTSGESQQDNELTVLFDAVECTRARTILDLEHHKMLKALAG